MCGIIDMVGFGDHKYNLSELP